MSLDLEPYRRRSAEIRATLEAQDFYDDPKATIPDDYDALIAECDRLVRYSALTVEMSRR